MDWFLYDNGLRLERVNASIAESGTCKVNEKITTMPQGNALFLSIKVTLPVLIHLMMDLMLQIRPRTNNFI